MYFKKFKSILFSSITFLCSFQALGHHAMDGRLPNTIYEGFISGLAHPVIGLDHLAFIVAMSILCAVYNSKRSILAFLGATLLGTSLHLATIDLANVEFLVALSVIVMGVVVSVGKHIAPGWLSVFTLAAGVIHGYAYGESIFGAEQTPLVAYLAGYILIQSCLSILVILGVHKIGARPKVVLMRSSALLCLLVGFINIVPNF